MFSFHPEDAVQATYLKARISVDQHVWHSEGNPKYVEKLIENMEWQNCSPATSPGLKASGKGDDEDEELNKREHKTLRGDA